MLPSWGKLCGPGGWWIVDEPELHLGRQIVVPDIGGWRRDRQPELPVTAYFETSPDWVCEVISPSSASYDRGSKRRIYATHGVKHYWLLDPTARVLEVFELQDGAWWLVPSW